MKTLFAEQMTADRAANLFGEEAELLGTRRAEGHCELLNLCFPMIAPECAKILAGPGFQF